MKSKQNILFFLVSFIVFYLIIGYLKSHIGVSIHWISEVTLTQKLKEYYIRSFFPTTIISLILSLISTTLFSKFTKTKLINN